MVDVIILITSLMFTYTTADLESLDPCAQRSSDTCLETTACDLFPSTSGETTCGIACDERFTQGMCAQDSTCAWTEGACGYAESTDIPGC